MRFEKKITPKNLFGSKEAIKLLVQGIAEGQTLWAYKVGGTITGMQDGVGTYGPWYKFVGEFLAIDMINGEEISSTAVCLQEPLQTMVLGQLKAEGSLEFAAEIGIRRRDDLATGYEFVMKPLIETKQPDHVERLKKLMLGAPESPKPILAAVSETADAVEQPAKEPEEAEAPKKASAKK